MGDSLVSLTYHEEGMGTPEDLCRDGISVRVQDWYDLAMGGAAANGRDVGNINTVGVDNLTDQPVPMLADLEVTSQVTGTNPKSADITVKVTVKEALPANSNLHIIIFQTRLDWQDEFGMSPSNGQTYMVNTVRELVTDTFGVKLPTLGVGQSHSITKAYTATPTIKYPEKLRVASLVQDMDTKLILSAAKTNKSPLDTGSTPIITNALIPEKTKLQIAFFSPQKLRVTLPFSNAKALVYNTAGRVLKRQILYGMEGDMATISLPRAEGLLFIKFISEDGKSLVCNINLTL